MTREFEEKIKMYEIFPRLKEVVEAREQEVSNFELEDMVKEFAQKSDRFLFDRDYMFPAVDYDEVKRFDERKKEIASKPVLIMDAESLDDLIDKISKADASFEKDNKSIGDQLKNIMKYLNTYFGVDRQGEELRPADFTLLHILYQVYNEDRQKKGILYDVQDSVFMRFYQSEYNPYYKIMLFIRTCFFQKIDFKEAYHIERVRRLVYDGIITTEERFFDDVKNIITKIDKKKLNLLNYNYISNHVRKHICIFASYMLKGLLSKKTVWEWRIEKELSEFEYDFLQAYFHFILLGIEDAINEPLISLENTEKVMSKINENYNIIPEIREWYDRDLRSIIKENSQSIAQLISDEESDLLKDKKKLKAIKANIKNHCDNYIRLCKFIYDNNVLKEIDSKKILILIYLYEKCSRDKIYIYKEGYKAGKRKRNKISMKNALSYLEKIDLSFLERGKDTEAFILEDIKRRNDGLEPLDFDEFRRKQDAKESALLKRIADADKVIDDDEVYKIYGLIALGYTIKSLYNGESKALIKSRKKMKKELYEYCKINIPLIKHQNCPFSDFEDLRYSILPQGALAYIVETKLSSCGLKKITGNI